MQAPRFARTQPSEVREHALGQLYVEGLHLVAPVLVVVAGADARPRDRAPRELAEAPRVSNQRSWELNQDVVRIAWLEPAFSL